MSTSEEVKKELSALLGSQKVLLDLAKDNKDIIEFGTKYQVWYSRTYKLVEALASERLAEFASYYLIDAKRKVPDASNYVLQDYIKGISARTNHYDKPLWDTNNVAMIRIVNQMHIIAALSSRVDSVLQDVTGRLFAELQDSELQAASQLKKYSVRAAGALAGVGLERHLHHVAVSHKVSITK